MANSLWASSDQAYRLDSRATVGLQSEGLQYSLGAKSLRANRDQAADWTAEQLGANSPEANNLGAYSLRANSLAAINLGADNDQATDLTNVELGAYSLGAYSLGTHSLEGNSDQATDWTAEQAWAYSVGAHSLGSTVWGSIETKLPTRQPSDPKLILLITP